MKDLASEIQRIDNQILVKRTAMQAEIDKLVEYKRRLQDAQRILTPQVVEALRSIDF